MKGTSPKGPGYDRRQANRISLRIVIAVAIALGAYMAFELSTDPISATDSSLRVTAIFGFSLSYSDIRELKYFPEPAPAGSRISGNEAFGLFREGNYTIDGIGVSRVFLKKPYVSYVYIRTEDKNYVLSLGSKEKDQLLYNAIKIRMK